MNTTAKKWLNATLAVGILSSGLVMGGGVKSEAYTVQPPYTNPIYSQEKLAMDAVAKAETTRWLSDVSLGRREVYKLKPSALKSSLENRLNLLEASIMRDVKVAMEKLSKAEETKLPTDIYSAKLSASAVKDPGYQNKFSYRLQVLEQVLVEKARLSVFKADETKLREDLLLACNVVSYLNAGKDKTYFTTKLDAIDKDIQAISRATDYVKRLESTFDKNLLSPARYYTSQVQDVNAKNKLMERIYKMEEQFRLQDQAVALVKRAEYTKSQFDIQNAKSVVYRLLNAELKSELLTRLRVVESGLVKIPTPINPPLSNFKYAIL